jgi:hypothetical protein
MLLKKEQGAVSKIVSIILLIIVSFFLFLWTPAYQDYSRRSKWSQAIASIGVVKLAIGECLNDSKGDLLVCNDVSSAKLGKYGLTSLPSNKETIQSVLVLKNATIRIEGADTLGKCVVDFQPKVNAKDGIVYWDIIARPPGEDGDTLDKCKTYVKGCG